VAITDEGRVIFPHHQYAYITPAPTIEDIDLTRCDYVLRRRNLHRIEGDLRSIRTLPDRHGRRPRRLILDPPLAVCPTRSQSVQVRHGDAGAYSGASRTAFRGKSNRIPG
jgi:hypothetical protein